MNLFQAYLKTIAKLNHLEMPKDEQWLFYPGMLFLSQEKWWPDKGIRPTEHEGIDITFYKDKNGIIQNFDRSVDIPLIEKGTVINICQDFLGHSLILEHAVETSNSNRIVSVYAHLNLDRKIKTGQDLVKNKVIGKIADTSVKMPLMQPHLHLSFIEIPAGIALDELDWTLFCDQSRVNLINPVEFKKIT